jgi:hypothetical protein
MGLIPDIAVSMTVSAFRNAEDPALEAAVSLLEHKFFCSDHTAYPRNAVHRSGPDFRRAKIDSGAFNPQGHSLAVEQRISCQHD